MKVGDGNNSSDPGDLLERMREAHRLEEASPLEQAGASSSVSGAGTADATGTEAPAAADALQQRLLDTAAKVLDGAFGSTDDVRRAVVEAIVEERYADKLGSAQAEQITRTLELTLTDDPVFKKEVDNMLLHAARQLAHRGD